MRNFYNDFYYVPKQEKIRDKVILTRLISTVTIMVICLAAMSITAYAYFSCNVTSATTLIKAGDFQTKVLIQPSDSKAKSVETIIPATSDNKIFNTTQMKAGEWYTITVSPSERNTAKTGFVIVSADNCKEIYHTQQIGVDERVKGGNTKSVSFKLMVTKETNVVFEAHWGTSSHYSEYVDKDDLYIIQDEQIEMVINKKEEPAAESNSDDSTDTTLSSEPQSDTSSDTESSTSSVATDSESEETVTSSEAESTIVSTDKDVTSQATESEKTDSTESATSDVVESEIVSTIEDTVQ